MDSISRSFLEVSQMRIRELDPITRVDHNFPTIAKAIRSAGNGILGIAYDPEIANDWLVTVNGSTKPALNDASWAIGASMLLVVLHRAGKAVSAGALMIAESELTEEELDYCSTLRQVFVSCGYIRH